MGLSAKACAARMAAIERSRAKHRAALAKLSAQYRAWAERWRAAQRADARRVVKREVAAKSGGKKVGKGRPVRWPGLCRACMMRHEGLPGGPPHRAALCEKTKAHIKKVLA